MLDPSTVTLFSKLRSLPSYSVHQKAKFVVINTSYREVRPAKFFAYQSEVTANDPKQ